MKKSDIEKVLSLLSDSKEFADDDRLSKLIGKAGELDADELDTIVAAAHKDRMRFSALLDRIDSEKNND
ncbi:MAG: hypothetical protein J6X34_00915 [Clostridia bacterium]|nr:hypothetical protein [Clostridia bacterium]MBP5779779.1 hypothetical protein [Clostridia bacterium]